MAFAVTFNAPVTTAYGATSLTIPLPAGAVGDILLVAVNGYNEGISNGGGGTWAKFGTDNYRHEMWWCRRVAGQGSLVLAVTGSGEDEEGSYNLQSFARIWNVSGATESGSPIDAVSGWDIQSSGTTATGAALSSTTTDAALFFVTWMQVTDITITGVGGSANAYSNGATNPLRCNVAYNLALGAIGAKAAPTATLSANGSRYAITFILKAGGSGGQAYSHTVDDAAKAGDAVGESQPIASETVTGAAKAGEYVEDSVPGVIFDEVAGAAKAGDAVTESQVITRPYLVGVRTAFFGGAGTLLSIPPPDGTAVDDTLVLVQSAGGTVQTSTGWTFPVNKIVGSGRIGVYARRATGGAQDTFTNSYSPNAGSAFAVMAFRGVPAGFNIDVIGTLGYDPTGINVVVPSIYAYDREYLLAVTGGMRADIDSQPALSGFYGMASANIASVRGNHQYVGIWYCHALDIRGVSLGASGNTGIHGWAAGSQGGFLLSLKAPTVSITDGAADAGRAPDAVADVHHDIDVHEVLEDVVEAKESPPADPERDHVPGPIADEVADAARAGDEVAMDAPVVQIAATFAAFGGTDPWSGANKGVISRPGDPYLGRRRNLGKASGADARGDRAFLHFARVEIPKSQANTVGRATLVVTPVVCATYDDSDPVDGPLATIRRAPALDLGTCLPGDALDAALAGDFGTLQMRPEWSAGDDPFKSMDKGPIWLMGGRGYTQTTKAWGQNPWEFDLTAAVNADLAAGRDPSYCFDFGSPTGERTDLKTVVEFFGTSVPALRPRLEVDPFGASAIDISGVNTGTPTLTVTVPNGCALEEIRWGYDAECSAGYLTAGNKSDPAPQENPYTFPMLETCARVYVKVKLNYGAADKVVTCERSFVTPKAFVPIRLASWNQLTMGGANSGVRHRSPFSGPHNQFGQIMGHVAVVPGGGVRIDEYCSAAQLVEEVEGGWYAPFADPSPNPLFSGMSDAGGASFDESSALLSLMTARLSGSRYAIDVYCAMPRGGEWGNWDMGMVGFQTPTLKVSQIGGLDFAAPPDGALFASTRTNDWRDAIPNDWVSQLAYAFVGDGKLYVYESASIASYTNAHFFGFPNGVIAAIGPVGSGATTEIDFDANTEVRFLHGMTRDRQKRLILVARAASGNCLIAARTMDSTETLPDGSAPTFVRGTWTVRTVPNFDAAYVTNPGLALDGVTDAPDWETSYLMLVRPSAPHLEALRLDSLLPGTPNGRAEVVSGTHAASAEHFTANPFPWGYGSGFTPVAESIRFWDGRIIDDFPRPAVTMMHTKHGGGVALWVEGGILKGQRIYDQARLSDVADLAVLTTTGTEIVASAEAYEGMPSTVLVGSSVAGWEGFAISAAMDISRLDLPTPDLKWRFTGGTLGTGNVDIGEPATALVPTVNMGDIEVTVHGDSGVRGLTHLPGYNTFALTWMWDKHAIGPNGIMNHSGTAKIRIRNGTGQAARIHVLNTSLGAGCWIDGVWRSYGYASWNNLYDGTPENIGGLEFPMIRKAPWFISQDGGATFDRLWDAAWIPDGESTNGGEVILQTPTLLSDDVIICKELPADYEQWQLHVTEWLARAQQLQDPAYGKLQCVNAQGDLLYVGTDPAKIGRPLSEVTDDGTRALRIWDPFVAGNATPLPGLPPTDNVKGCLISWDFADGGKPYWDSLAQRHKRLIVIVHADDASEQVAARAGIRSVEFLLSGDRKAKALLRVFDFLVIPMMSQANTKRGFARYPMDSKSVGPGLYATQRVDYDAQDYPRQSADASLWGNSSRIGTLSTRAAVEQWVTRALAAGVPSQYQGELGFCEYASHCDTHNRYTAFPYVTPFSDMAFPGYTETGALLAAGIALFREGFDAMAWRELWAHNADGVTSPLVGSPGGPESLRDYGGTNFYFEIPWGGGTAPKSTYWLSDDTILNHVEGFMYGISVVGLTTEAYDEDLTDAAIGPTSVGDQRIALDQPADGVEARDAASDQAIGLERPADTVIAPDASVAQARITEQAAEAARARDAVEAGVQLSEDREEAAKTGDVADFQVVKPEARTDAGITTDATSTQMLGVQVVTERGVSADVIANLAMISEALADAAKAGDVSQVGILLAEVLSGAAKAADAVADARARGEVLADAGAARDAVSDTRLASEAVADGIRSGDIASVVARMGEVVSGAASAVDEILMGAIDYLFSVAVVTDAIGATAVRVESVGDGAGVSDEVSGSDRPIYEERVADAASAGDSGSASVLLTETRAEIVKALTGLTDEFVRGPSTYTEDVWARAVQTDETVVSVRQAVFDETRAEVVRVRDSVTESIRTAVSNELPMETARVATSVEDGIVNSILLDDAASARDQVYDSIRSTIIDEIVWDIILGLGISEVAARTSGRWATLVVRAREQQRLVVRQRDARIQARALFQVLRIIAQGRNE